MNKLSTNFFPARFNSIIKDIRKKKKKLIQKNLIQKSSPLVEKKFRPLITRSQNLREKGNFISRLNPPVQSTRTSTLSTVASTVEKEKNELSPEPSGKTMQRRRTDRYGRQVRDPHSDYSRLTASTRGGIWLSIYYRPKPDHFEMLNDELFRTRWQP